MKVTNIKTTRDFYKVSTNTGKFYEFIKKECDVEDKDDIEFFSNHPDYVIEIKGKKGGN